METQTLIFVLMVIQTIHITKGTHLPSSGTNTNPISPTVRNLRANSNTLPRGANSETVIPSRSTSIISPGGTFRTRPTSGGTLRARPTSGGTRRARPTSGGTLRARPISGGTRRARPININIFSGSGRPSVVNIISSARLPRVSPTRVVPKQFSNNNSRNRRRQLRGSPSQPKRHMTFTRRNIPVVNTGSAVRRHTMNALRQQVGKGIFGPEPNPQILKPSMFHSYQNDNKISSIITTTKPQIMYTLPTIKPQRTKTQDTITSPVVTNSNNLPNQGASSLLNMLHNRRSETQNKLDEQLIRRHLILLDSMREGGRNKNRVLTKQMEYVKRITDYKIQREVLKLLVKDIIEKSGAMGNDTRQADVRSLTHLINMVNQITSEFIQTKPTTTAEPVTLSSLEQRRRDRQSLRIRIAKALNVFHPPDISNGFAMPETNSDISTSNDSNFETVTQTGIYEADTVLPLPEDSGQSDTVDSVVLPEVGMSIYGDAISQPEQPESVAMNTTPRGLRNTEREPFGGDLGYWTHLSGGITDMLCGLCKQQGLETCITRFCTDDN